MTIRRADINDLPEIFRVYDKARAFMRSYGNEFQWTDGYPSEALLLSDISRGDLYVGIGDSGHIVCVFAFILGIDPTYINIYDGAWKNDRPYGTIHRLGSDGSEKNVFGQCLDFCFTLADSIRIDTHRVNHPMQAAAKKFGFEYCGIIYIEDGSERLAFQKDK